MSTWKAGAAVAIATLLGGATAQAEIVYLTTGRTLSVRGVRYEAGRAVLALRGGGEVVCAPDLIARVLPDEVPEVEESGRLPQATSTAVRLGGVPHADRIARAAAAHDVDPVLVHAVVAVESAYREGARSPKGAMGLMQLMPETARRYAVTDPFDPEQNLGAGVKHLRTLLDEFDLSLALAAYNAGEEAVRRYGGIPPYAETRRYVQKVLGLVSTIRASLP